ncbi:MAG TPA: hypothetical protein VF493_05420 [Terriglobales bacterium]
MSVNHHLHAPAIIAARQAKVPWKVLAAQYGVTVRWLQAIVSGGPRVDCPACGHSFRPKKKANFASDLTSGVPTFGMVQQST